MLKKMNVVKTAAKVLLYRQILFGEIQSYKIFLIQAAVLLKAYRFILVGLVENVNISWALAPGFSKKN